jgi:replicative DNA helicase
VTVTSTTPTDPVAFDFNIGFKSSGDRIAGELDERKSYGARALRYHVPFLDDVLRGIAPHDLVLLGAPTGAGKTDLVRLVAQSNARQMKRVHLFALEAEQTEIERRTKYSLLAEFAHRAGRDLSGLNYRDWYFGRCEHLVGEFNENADRKLATDYKHLHTYYRGARFDMHEMARLFKAIQSQTDLIILDHLHYVDLDGDNENTEYARMLKLIRVTALEMGKPVILVAHLRKRDLRSRAVVPEIEMFHGSSEITKVSTVAIMLAPARQLQERARWYESYTFLHVPKDRMGGVAGYVAACPFDRRFKNYGESYTLGRLNAAGDEWTEIDPNDRPAWAQNHRGLQ